MRVRFSLIALALILAPARRASAYSLNEVIASAADAVTDMIIACQDMICKPVDPVAPSPSLSAAGDPGQSNPPPMPDPKPSGSEKAGTASGGVGGEAAEATGTSGTAAGAFDAAVRLANARQAEEARERASRERTGGMERPPANPETPTLAPGAPLRTPGLPGAPRPAGGLAGLGGSPGGSSNTPGGANPSRSAGTQGSPRPAGASDGPAAPSEAPFIEGVPVYDPNPVRIAPVRPEDLEAPSSPGVAAALDSLRGPKGSVPVLTALASSIVSMAAKDRAGKTDGVDFPAQLFFDGEKAQAALNYRNGTQFFRERESAEREKF